MREYRDSAKRRSLHDKEGESSRRGYNFQDKHQSELVPEDQAKIVRFLQGKFEIFFEESKRT
jgi:hypothetical protein